MHRIFQSSMNFFEKTQIKKIELFFSKKNDRYIKNCEDLYFYLNELLVRCICLKTYCLNLSSFLYYLKLFFNKLCSNKNYLI